MRVSAASIASSVAGAGPPLYAGAVRLRPGALVLVAAALLAGVASAFVASRVLDSPPGLDETPPSAVTRLRAHERLAQLALREARPAAGRGEPVVVTAAEVNALLATYLDPRTTGLTAVVLTLGAGRIGVNGRTSLGRVLAESGPAWASRLLPRPLAELPVWVVGWGRLEAGAGRARFTLESAAVGRQPVSPALAAALLPPELLAERRLPRMIDRVEVKPGRLVIHPR